MTVLRESKFAVRADGPSTWTIQCEACERTLGRRIPGEDGQMMAQLALAHSCAAQYPDAETVQLTPGRSS